MFSFNLVDFKHVTYMLKVTYMLHTYVFIEPSGFTYMSHICRGSLNSFEVINMYIYPHINICYIYVDLIRGTKSD